MNIRTFLNGQNVNKAMVVLAVLIMLPTSIAVAEPNAGNNGSVALSNAASTVAVPGLKRPKEEHLMAVITAYTPRVEENDSDPLISADGNYVYDGLIACSREYPFGTKVIVNGRTYRCGDRMARKNDHATNLSLSAPHFDIWMASLSSARQWGRRSVPVTIVYNTN